LERKSDVDECGDGFDGVSVVGMGEEAGLVGEAGRIPAGDFEVWGIVSY